MSGCFLFHYMLKIVYHKLFIGILWNPRCYLLQGVFSSVFFQVSGASSSQESLQFSFRIWTSWMLRILVYQNLGFPAFIPNAGGTHDSLLFNYGLFFLFQKGQKECCTTSWHLSCLSTISTAFTGEMCVVGSGLASLGSLSSPDPWPLMLYCDYLCAAFIHMCMDIQNPAHCP